VVKNHELNWSKQFDPKQGVAEMARIFIYAKEEVAEIMAIALSMRGHIPLYSDRPREAMRQIITFRPKLVLAEYLEVDGQWLCSEIRRIKQLEATQVIMMSKMGQPLSDQDLESTVLAFGANGYLPQPLPCREIGNYVNSWLKAS
jgi:DNA-binding response OmpR family regulator